MGTFPGARNKEKPKASVILADTTVTLAWEGRVTSVGFCKILSRAKILKLTHKAESMPVWTGEIE